MKKPKRRVRKPAQREAMPTSLTLTPVVLTAGETVSAPLSVASGTAEYLVMPDDWTPAYLSFQISFDAVVWYDLFDDLNKEKMIDNPTPGTAVDLSEVQFRNAQFRIRSGLRNNPIAQEADRTFVVAIAP